MLANFPTPNWIKPQATGFGVTLLSAGAGVGWSPGIFSGLSDSMNLCEIACSLAGHKACSC